jgi:hypothetical protein
VFKGFLMRIKNLEIEKMRRGTGTLYRKDELANIEPVLISYRSI